MVYEEAKLKNSADPTSPAHDLGGQRLLANLDNHQIGMGEALLVAATDTSMSSARPTSTPQYQVGPTTGTAASCLIVFQCVSMWEVDGSSVSLNSDLSFVRGSD